QRTFAIGVHLPVRSAEGSSAREDVVDRAYRPLDPGAVDIEMSDRADERAHADELDPGLRHTVDQGTGIGHREDDDVRFDALGVDGDRVDFGEPLSQPTRV